MFSRCLKIVSVFVFLTLGACETVQPWQKDKLAKREMSFVVDSLESKMSNHVHFAKEATAAGAELAGGGCGCN